MKFIGNHTALTITLCFLFILTAANSEEVNSTIVDEEENLYINSTDTDDVSNMTSVNSTDKNILNLRSDLLEQGQEMADRVNTQRLEQRLLEFVRLPKMSGHLLSRRAVAYVQKFWRRLGLGDVRTSTYYVNLPYLDTSQDNRIEVYDMRTKEVLFRVKGARPLTDEDKRLYDAPDLLFNGFDDPIDYENNSIFLNPDAEEQKQVAGNSPSVVMISQKSKDKYEFINPSFKNGNTRPVVLYFLNKTHRNYENEYPKGMGWTKTAVKHFLTVERKVAHSKLRGDAETPLFPSTKTAKRVKLKRTQPPKLLSISLQDAEDLIYHLKFDNKTARNRPDRGLRILWAVRFSRRPIMNVCARIPGTQRPERWIVIGSHRDAVNRGALDPGSGHILLQEIGAIFTEWRNKGWRPRRSILLCSWDAEEFGLIGSVEWIEENLKELHEKMEAYINLDSCFMDCYRMHRYCTANIDKFSKYLLSLVSDPKVPEKTVLEATKDIQNKWSTSTLTGRSDFFGFEKYVDSPILQFLYAARHGIYSLYHTNYETINLVRMLDPNFKCIRTLTQAKVIGIRYLADTLFLPMDGQGLEDKVKIPDMRNQTDQENPFKKYFLDSLTRIKDKLQKLGRKLTRISETASTNTNENQAMKYNDCIVKIGRPFIVKLRYEPGEDGLTVNNLLDDQDSLNNCIKFNQQTICRKVLKQGEAFIDTCLEI